MKTYFTNEDFKSIPRIDFCEDYDKGHGRLESIKCWVANEVSWLKERHPHWSSIQSIVRVDSVRDIKGKVSTETRYYVSSDGLEVFTHDELAALFAPITHFSVYLELRSSLRLFLFLLFLRFLDQGFGIIQAIILFLQLYFFPY